MPCPAIACTTSDGVPPHARGLAVSRKKFDGLLDHLAGGLVGIAGSVIFNRAISLKAVLLQDAEGLRHVHVSGLAVFIRFPLFYMTNPIGVREHHFHRAILKGLIVCSQRVPEVG